MLIAAQGRQFGTVASPLERIVTEDPLWAR